MSSSLKNLSDFSTATEIPSAEAYTFGIVVAEWKRGDHQRVIPGCL